MKIPPIDIPGTGALHAKIETSLGSVVARLEEKRAPKTVANFVGLATGAIEWVDPKSGNARKNEPFYDGLLFHRCLLYTSPSPRDS